MKPRDTIVIFDLDGTLININSTFVFIEKEIKNSCLIRKILYKLIKKLKIIFFIFSKLIKKKDFYRDIAIFITLFLKNKNKIVSIKKEISDNLTIYYKELLKYKKKGYKVYILTATIDAICKDLREIFIEVDKIICSKCASIGNYYLGFLSTDLLPEKNKLKIIKILLKKYKKIVIYEDNKNIIKLLKQYPNVITYLCK